MHKNKAHPLKDFLNKNKITALMFAELLNVNQSNISRIFTENRIPRKELLEKIYLVTNGVIKPNDFYDFMWEKDNK